MNKKKIRVFRYIGVLSFVGALSLSLDAAEGSVNGKVLSISVSGIDSLDITVPYNSVSGELFALVDIEIENSIPSTLVLDSESERAMLVNLILSLAADQGVILKGELVADSTGNRIDPITKVTFN